MDEFRNQLLKYLFVEKKLEEEEVEKNKLMSREEKVDNNLLLVDASIVCQDGILYELNVPENYSKLRAGDKIVITDDNTASKYDASIVDVFFDTITVSCEKQLDNTSSFSIEQKSPGLLQSLISCLEGIYSGVPGAAFLRLLSGEDKFEVEDFLKVDINDVPSFDDIKNSLTEEQLSAVSSMLEYPPVHVLQGPPGTGKTLVLAATAIATARMNREVVIIANTHHAVNNALLKIQSLDKNANLIKIGDALKADELGDSVLNFEKISDYYDYSYKNRKKKKSGHIIGMTIWGAVAHLGLRHHAHFRPYQALVDEASLMPLSLATILGKTAPSVCLFGDSRQMPPIFRPELEKNKFSSSILDYCVENVEGIPISVLHNTFRMNEEITSVVSKCFYEPYGIKLLSSEYSKNRTFDMAGLSQGGTQNSIICIPSESICLDYKDYNPEEAKQVITIAKDLLSQGVNASDIAVITPWRKQVRAIREASTEILGDPALFLIDTVERLQGQDVDVIIINFACSDEIFMNAQASFLFNPNRLNVMISRAKKKVIIVASQCVAEKLKNIINS